MDLRELGTTLREERERQGLTIEDVSDRIKITRSCLTAIEEGNQSVLPHPVYAKGFIKNYARLLGLNQEDFTQRLSEVYPPEEPTLREVPLIQDIPDDDCGCAVKPASKLPLVPALICLAAVLVVAGLGWYLFAHVFSKSADNAGSVAPQATVEPVPPIAESETARPVPVVPAPKPIEPAPVVQAPTPKPVEPAPVAQAPAPAPKTETKALVEPSPEDRATQDIATSGPAAAAPPAIPSAPESAPTPPVPTAKTFTVGEHGPHTVSIVATERCWLQAGADGGTMRETMLEKGDTFTGRFADYLLVRLGNAAAVEIRFDNKLYPLQAGKGSVKTLKFVAKKTDDEAAKTAPPAETPAPAVTPAVPPRSDLAPATPSQASGGETAQGAKEVEIYGQDGSWVIVSPDKGPSKEIYVKKGQRITVPFGEKIEIKLGNPSNVVFRYDGKETPVVTEKGATKTIRFP